MLDYRSPLEGKLWNWVWEFPLYQWLVYLVMKMEIPLEVAARLVTLAAFFGGVYYFALLLHKFWGLACALWGTLIYLITPFNVLYSRVCLIDFLALFFVLGSLYYFVRSLNKNSTGVYLLGLSTLLGALGGLVKVNVWVFPFVVQALVLVWHIRKSIGIQSLIAGGVFSLQALVVGTWLAWTGSLRGESGMEMGHLGWYVGTWHQRVVWFWWGIILKNVSTSLLHFWVVIPFLVGLFSPGRMSGSLHKACIILAFMPVFVFFNVHEKHDYYFIAEVPYYIALAAIGMVRVLNFQWVRRLLYLLSVLPLFAWACKDCIARYGPIFKDYNELPMMILPRQLKDSTSELDTIYMDQTSSQLHLPLYAQRWIGMDETVSMAALNPSVIYLTQKQRVSELDQFSRIWIEGKGRHFHVYRVREVESYPFRGDRHFGVADEWPKPGPPGEKIQKIRVWDGVHPITENLCGANSVQSLIRIENPKGILEVTTREKRVVFKLPTKKYVFLAKNSPWGCHYELKGNP